MTLTINALAPPAFAHQRVQFLEANTSIDVLSAAGLDRLPYDDRRSRRKLDCKSRCRSRLWKSHRQRHPWVPPWPVSQPGCLSPLLQLPLDHPIQIAGCKRTFAVFPARRRCHALHASIAVITQVAALLYPPGSRRLLGSQPDLTLFHDTNRPSPSLSFTRHSLLSWPSLCFYNIFANTFVYLLGRLTALHENTDRAFDPSRSIVISKNAHQFSRLGSLPASGTKDTRLYSCHGRP